MPKRFIRACNSRHENTLIRDFTIFVSSSSSAFSLLEPVDALNFSLNVSRDAGGVHRRKAIFVFLPPIAKTDSWLALQQRENDAIFTRLSKPNTHLLIAAPRRDRAVPDVYNCTVGPPNN